MSVQMPIRSSNRCDALQRRKGGPLVKRSPGSSQPASSWKFFYPNYLANPVLVLKKNNTWRVCIDYTSLNKTCPKDPFALPRIDQVIDSTAGSDLLSFLDAYSGYHQIPLYKPHQIKMSFITPYGAYCYVTIPFGLKNAGATYQRTMQRCMHRQIGQNVHAYIDGMVVKTKQSGTLLDDLRETFANLRRYRMKLNPEKCTFGVPAGQLVTTQKSVIHFLLIKELNFGPRENFFISYCMYA
jgi:hypothetical protein